MSEIGCPDDALGEQANERLSQLDELFKNVDSLHELETRIRGIDADANDFAAQVTEMCERVAPELCDIDAAEAATELRKRIERASNDDVRRSELTTTLNARIADLHKAEKSAGTLQTQLDQFCRMAGVSDDAALSELERQSAEYVSCTDKLNEVKEQLMSLCIDGTVESLTEEIGERSADELGAELAALDDQIAEAEVERERVVRNVHDLENDRNRADGSSIAAEADEEALGILARMQEDASRYMKLRVAAALLRRQIDRHRAENQDPLLDRASKLFAKLTCESYRGLRTEYNDADQPQIAGVRASGESVDVVAMSDGTRDQLFLALRLAYVERRLDVHEPMPFVVDDILIHFDDDRSIATLKVLEELSKRTQVIFFTHHKHLVDLATAALPLTSVFLHQLDGHCEVPTTATCRPRRRRIRFGLVFWSRTLTQEQPSTNGAPSTLAHAC